MNLRKWAGKFLNFKIIIAVWISYVLGKWIVIGMPLQYIAGFLAILALSALFFKNPLYFLFVLFLTRSGIDSFLSRLRFGISGVNLGMGGAISLFIIGMTVVYILTSEKSIKLLFHPVTKLNFIFCLISIGSAVISPDKSEAVKALIRNYSILAIFLLTLSVVKNERSAYLTLKAMVWSALPCLVVGIGQYAYKHEWVRFAATLGHPNILAFYLLIVLGMFLFRLNRAETPLKFSLMEKFAFLFLLVTLLSTGTRSGWLAFGMLIAFYALFYNRRLIVPVILIAILMGSVPMVRNHIGNLFSSYSGSVSINEESSLGWRFEKWKCLLAAAVKRPLTGYGIDAARTFGDTLEAHNDYLRFFIESGIFGVIFYFAPYFYVLRHSWKNRACYAQNSCLKKLSGFFIVFIPSFLIMSFSENLAGYVIIHWYLWAIMGIYFGLAQNEQHA